MAKKEAARGTVEVCIEPLNLRSFDVRIRGKTALLTHAKGDLVRQLLKHQERKAQKEAAKNGSATARVEPLPPVNIDQLYQDALYPLDGKPGKYGFPAGAFKAAAIEACRWKGIEMTRARGFFQVLGDRVVELKYERLEKRVDALPLPTGNHAPHIVVRGEFTHWSCDLTITHNADVIDAESIINLLNWAGFHVGVGSHRPFVKGGGNGGHHGMFTVETAKK